MSRRNPDSFAAFEHAFDWFLVGGAALLLLALCLAYFGVPSLKDTSSEMRQFLQSVISNLVPTILVFILAYVLLYRRIQKLRAEEDTHRSAARIAEVVVAEVRRAGEKTKLVERSDRFPLPLADLDWLYAADDMIKLEARMRDEIWIVSPHLANDTGTQYEETTVGTSTIKMVQENLRRKVSYTFVVPDTVPIRALLPQLNRNYAAIGKVRVVLLPPGDFQVLASSEMVIYDPKLRSRHTPGVFMELPVSSIHNYWVMVDDANAAAFVTRVQNIIDTHLTSKNES